MSAGLAPIPEREEPIRFIRPTVPSLRNVIRMYESSFKGGMLTNSDLVARLENAVAERLGVKYCLAVSSCTSGLMLVMKALGLEGEVILPSFTFFATGHAILWNGLTPVFADCDPNTWTIDPADVEARITSRTCAIVAVHLYGNPAAVAPMQDIARKHGLKLIFDAAHAFGSSLKGVPVGGFGDAEVFSLSPTKLLVAGEGGLVCTNDATLANRIRAGRNYGDLGDYDPMLLGLNARMTEFNAALALAGMRMVDRKIQRHMAIAEQYTNALSGEPGIAFQHIPEGARCGYKDFSVLVTPSEFGLNRDEMGEILAAQGIPTKKYFYPPLHRQAIYAPYSHAGKRAFPVTDRVSGTVLSLPIYESLQDETVDRISLAIRRRGQVAQGGAR